MRHVVIGFCVFAAACGSASPTAPTSPASASAASPIGGGTIATEAKSGSSLPFNGNLQATEAVDGALHHLVGSGNGAHLGRFTYTADITVDDETGDGAGSASWTAANGDRILAATTGRILVADFPTGRITIGETQIITSGTGRFSGASGTINIERSLDLLTGVTGGSYTGTIDLRK